MWRVVNGIEPNVNFEWPGRAARAGLVVPQVPRHDKCSLAQWPCRWLIDVGDRNLKRFDCLGGHGMDHCGAVSAAGCYCPEKICNLEDGARLMPSGR